MGMGGASASPAFEPQEIQMDTKTPYGPGIPVRKTPDTMSHERSKSEGKAKARYPHKPLSKKPGGG